ncbi:hypothetical protein Emag_007071 [Eimeria magna]
MAVVSLISYCRVWIMSSVGSALVRRRLASAGEEGVEEAKEQKYRQVCGTPRKEMDPEEETSTGAPSRQPPTFEVLGGGSLIEGDYSRKRKSDHEHGEEHDVAPKAVKLTDGEGVREGTSGVRDVSYSEIDFLFIALGRRRRQREESNAKSGFIATIWLE